MCQWRSFPLFLHIHILFSPLFSTFQSPKCLICHFSLSSYWHTYCTQSHVISGVLARIWRIEIIHFLSKSTVIKTLTWMMLFSCVDLKKHRYHQVNRVHVPTVTVLLMYVDRFSFLSARSANSFTCSVHRRWANTIKAPHCVSPRLCSSESH